MENKNVRLEKLAVIAMILIIVALIAIPALQRYERNKRLGIGNRAQQAQAIESAIKAYAHDGEFKDLPAEIISVHSSQTWDERTIITIGTHEYYYQGDICEFDKSQILPLGI